MLIAIPFAPQGFFWGMTGVTEKETEEEKVEEEQKERKRKRKEEEEKDKEKERKRQIKIYDICYIAFVKRLFFLLLAPGP